MRKADVSTDAPTNAARRAVLTTHTPVEESAAAEAKVAVYEVEADEFRFNDEEASRVLAAEILSSGDSIDPLAYTKLLWRLIYEDKEALAAQLAMCNEQMFEDRSVHIESALLRSVVLARHVRGNAGMIAHELKRSLESISVSDAFRPGDFGWNRAMRFLLASASLGPTLLGSSTNAANVLRALYFKDGLDHLWEIGNKITEYSTNFRELDLSALEVARDESQWKKTLDELSGKVETWWSRARGIQFTYGPARQVWWRWLEEGQLVHSLLAPIRAKTRNNVGQLRAEVQRLCDDGAIRSAIDRTDREVRNRGSDITATAFGQLKRHLQDEVLEFARQWIKLQSSSPSARGDFHYVQTRQLRTFILDRREAVDAELDAFEREHGSSLPTRAGIACCRRALRSLYSLLAEHDGGVEPDIRYVLRSDLLRVKGVALAENWEPEATDATTLARGILDLIANDRFKWFDNLRDRCSEDERDHEAATRIVDLVLSTDPDNTELESMQSYNNRHLAQFQEALRRDIDATRSCIENAVAFDLLKESERSKLMGILEPLQRSVESVRRFGESGRRLKQIRDDIEAKRQIALNSVRSRLATSSKIPPDSDAWRRITSVLDTGDIYTANEYLELAEVGDPLPLMGERRDCFREFFPETAATLERYIGETAPATILANLKQRLPLAGRSLGDIEESHLRTASTMAEAWLTAKRQQRLGEDAATSILRGIGFPTLTVQYVPTNVRNRTWLHVQSEIVADRERCPVFVFGSQANGRYRVLCLWNSPTHEDILSYAGENPHASPLIIFYFGCMGTEKRRNVARLHRDARRTCLVLDDTLMLFLCAEPGSRLPAFFSCTMPFTYLEPYTITAGTVPPEMFYGRRREIESIVNPHGSCFIFGGRQLGKTALLRAAERRFHDPAAGRVARWLDLKAEGLGFNRSLDDIWPLIANLLKEKDARILPPGFSAFSDPSRLFGHIRTWLDADTGRRIILLLDEADRFLESDAKENFTRSGRLKNWMDQTGRRFKVVFAGLHNVQRSTRQANNPLAHFGEPICIGPLLEQGEWKEARALVEHPLETVGFRFESPDLVTRILSQTNYYPSLLQLYCNQLLRFFARRHYASFDLKNSPPYCITSKDVEEAYQSGELRRDIRNRFRWTLDLDPRYRVIALSIAFGVAISGGGSAGDPADEGFSIGWIRDQAFSFWPKGFENVSSPDEFMSLLHEMIGLGVLREVKPGFFALRSPNLLTLLGTEDEIVGELDAAAGEEPLPVYEPEKFRSGDPTNQLRRSPLTAAQESEIKAGGNGVSVVFGSEAAGLGDLRYFLRLAKEDFFVDLDGDEHNHSGFLAGLAGLKKREQGGTTVGFVSSVSAWDEAWIAAADHRIRELSPTRNFLRTVFAADPQTTWMLLRTNTGLTDSLIQKRVTTFSLMPWHEAALNQWLNDAEFAITRENRVRLAATTGRWPMLLHDVAQNARKTTDWGAEIEALESSFSNAEKASLLCKRFGLDTRPRTGTKATCASG